MGGVFLPLKDGPLLHEHYNGDALSQAFPGSEFEVPRRQRAVRRCEAAR